MWSAVAVLAAVVAILAWRVFRLEQAERRRTALMAAATKDAVMQRLVARIEDGPKTPGREMLQRRLAAKLKAKAG